MAIPRRFPLWHDKRALRIDVLITALNTLANINVINAAQEAGAREQDALAYALAVLMGLPLLVRRRWPLVVLLGASVPLFAYYSIGYPGITPSVPIAVPLYTAVLAGRLGWAVSITAAFFGTGYFMQLVEGQGPLDTLADFLPQIALVAVVILLAEVVVSRRELAAETRERLRRAEQEREREAARRVAEERLRIARELHDTVAHSMATITVQAGSVLHGLRGRPEAEDGGVRQALLAIRATSRDALREMRGTLGLLRADGELDRQDKPGLDRLPALLDAVRAGGLKVDFEARGAARELPAAADHAAYRIVQESLTNVLRHAGPAVHVVVRIAYEPECVSIRVADDGTGPAKPGEGNGDGSGHGLDGMRERTEALGGAFHAGPGADGGFMVSAQLPTR